jgi:hypothetical protein
VGSLFGVAVSPLATAANAATAGTRVKAIASAAAAPVGRYTRLLETRLAALGIDGHAADRLKTAAATGTVLAQVAAAAPRDVVAVLSRATVPTSERAMSECITKAGPWSQALEDRVWDLVGQIEHAGAEARAGAEPILADVRDALAHDDHVATTPLKDVLDAAYPRLLAVLVRKPAPPPQPTPQPPVATAVPLPAIAPVPMSSSTGKVPARGSETIASADAVQARIDQIRAEWPGARIEVVIRWSEGP